MSAPNPRNPFAAHDPYAAGAGRAPTGAAVPDGAAFAPPAASGPPPEVVVDITEADFEAQVLERSLDVPVLLDCWAPWCGPCRSLGPILEKLALAYGGRFILAKINTDEAPNVSAALRIRSIPLVVLFIGGRPVDQFVGALPEGQIRQFIDKHLQNLPPGMAGDAGGSPVEQLREEAKAADTAGNAEDAEAILREALDIEPGHVEVTLDLAERLIARAALDEADALLEQVPADSRKDRHEGLVKRLAIARNRPAGDAKALAARIAGNPRDFEARFALAAIHMFDGRYPAAFEQLLDVVLRDKGEQREKARRQLVDWFSACPDAEAVSQGRRYLGMYLN
jgi:putative thioredoxin